VGATSRRDAAAVADRVPPVALVLTGVTSIQFGAAFARTLFDDLGAAGTSALRLVFAAAILVALTRPRLRGRPAGDLRLVLVFGLVLGAMNLTFYEALARIPLGVAVTIEFLGPLAVAVAASRRPLDGLWVLLAGAGVVLLANPGGAGVDAAGLGLAFVAAAFWGTYIVLAQRAGSRFTGSEGVALATVAAALVPLGPGIAEAGGALLSAKMLLLGPVVGLLSSVIPYSLETEALRRIPRGVFGVLMSLEPGVGALAGFVVLGQALGARELLAIALVVVASIGALRAAAPPPEA
jgi:inner membrane transporter RhtA